MNVRALALRMLNEYEAGGKYVNLSLSSHTADGLSREERGALTALLYTSVERKLTYDYYICALSKRGENQIEMNTRNILRLGLCQLLDMHSIPDFAAVNETVKLARSKGEASFVNGVLRQAQRRKNNMPLPDEKKNYKRYLSVKYSFPLGIVKHFDSIFGREETEELLEFFNEKKYTDITVNTTKISVDKYVDELEKQGFSPELNDFAKNSIRISESVNPEKLYGFSEGLFFVQDRASAICAGVLAPQANQRIIDVCAAPGGKSFAAATLMGNKGEIFSFDLHESKLSLIKSGAMRLGFDIISVSGRDALSPDDTLFESADKVICDAPCSGLGVLGKKPDLRYKDLSAIDSLPALQLEILEKSSKYLKKGGDIVYSTCTLNYAENEGVISTFLDKNADFELVPFTVGEIFAEKGFLTLYPHRNCTDGFFMAKLRKKS